MSGKRDFSESKKVNPGENRPSDPSLDLPDDLKPFEAALASLAPADRLDGDLILFRAGQLSVTAGAPDASDVSSGPISPLSRLAMPLGLVTMTIIAGALFVTLLTRPVVERVTIVRVPVETTQSVAALQPVDEPDTVSSEGDEDGKESESEDAKTPETRLASNVSNTQRVRVPDHLIIDPSRVRAIELERFRRMLQYDLDPNGGPTATSSSKKDKVQPPAQPKLPVPYRQQLRDLLDARASTAWPEIRSNFSLHSGAHS